MTEGHDRRHWTSEQHDQHARELAAQREAWEQQKRREAEQKEREALQEELATHLRRRGRDWQLVTGTEPPREEMERWQREFMDTRAIEQEADREARLLESIESNYDF